MSVPATAHAQWLRAKRPLHTAHITLNGVELVCEHFISGTHLAQTDIDDAERPTCELRDVLVNGVSVKGLLSEEQLNDIAELVERAL